jgi:hypothetical protein
MKYLNKHPDTTALRVLVLAKEWQALRDLKNPKRVRAMTLVSIGQG